MIRLLTFLALATPAAAQDLCICPQCISSAFDRYSIVSAHMEPTLQVGQCVIAQMIAADPATPQPKDLIVFRHPVSGIDHIFRLIAAAGDTAQLVDGQLILNDTPVPRTPLSDYQPSPDNPGPPADAPQFRETLPNGASYAVIDLGRTEALNTTGPLTVPERHVFVLGDNRDNARDSRFSPDVGGPGFVPTDNIRGLVREIRPLP